MTKKPSESFKEYAQQWHHEASKVQLRLRDKKTITTSLAILPLPIMTV